MSETAAGPQQTTVLDNVRALLPEIRARAEEIEQARAVPRDLAEKLRSAGVFRRYVPRSHGGDEMWPDEGLTVIEELARADASVAWVAAVGSEGPSFYAYLPSDTYDKIFSGGPDVIHTGVINPTGKAVRDKRRLPVQRPLVVRQRLQQRRLHLHPRRARRRAGAPGWAWSPPARCRSTTSGT